ncbi:hypothetical protein Esi_0025_0093 [Ectocarpus siliculosus]|uniref:Uncharacterized protein n=1 Tax=Ectocarpus siliculosus TaxID=2880 RepID=D7FTG4_ECTSI|nr:hypothetical protein Esi_0025_0093 [Ectocarpus siliculosus]|eukprot:CBJ48542.1 hypothetical protein Esi_0025_0093 [Ectocarpus siliculosus]
MVNRAWNAPELFRLWEENMSIDGGRSCARSTETAGKRRTML